MSTKEESKRTIPAVVTPGDSRRKTESSGGESSQSSNKETYILSQDASNDDYEDQFYYSDDSESLTDNYFNPQHGDDSFYGSFDNTRASPSRAARQMQYPPIQEDSEVTQATHLLSSPFRHLTKNPSSSSNTNSDKRRTRKKKKRQMGRRSSGDDQRERAVHRIRGELQSPTEYHGRAWSILFLIQLLFVLVCAVRYGWTLLKPPNATLANNNSNNPRFLSRSSKATTGNQISPPEDSGATNVPKALMNVTSSVNQTVAYSKDLKNLQDDDFIQFEHSQASGLVKDSGLVSAPAAKNRPGNINPQAPESSLTTNPFLFRIDYRTVISIFSISGFYALVTSYLSFGFMLSVARSVIPIVLIFTIIFAFCWGLFGLTIMPHSSIAILGFACFVLALGYAIRSWKRISFCSINLYTAMSALRDTSGILFIGVGSLFVTFVWLLIWLIALIGIFNTSNAKECRQSQIDCRTHLILEHDRYFQLAILIFSLFWTCIVIKNIVRTTIAGACGAWWFGVYGQPQGWGCVDSIIWNHLVRSCTSSLGSICLGSLLEIPVQAMSMLGGTFCCCITDRSSSMHSERSTDEHPVPAIATIGRERSLNSISSWEGEEHSFSKELCNRIRCCNRWCYTYIGK